MTLTTISVGEIQQGDEFVADGVLCWVADDNAYIDVDGSASLCVRDGRDGATVVRRWPDHTTPIEITRG